ncbi:DUF2188 domain-containing protein (plasmid) [Bradyrhizobium quebecense]|jgi:hypothetical protein|uniref:DUF2188 domain-containing protein n=1 Tax=Bradyrhizobium quebecense TaxID=2748629 RepID=UPI001CD74252|nr:DUF2188 domain-containing protein [Bradyrhizobium quebecense]UGA49063.1 DUF2188 domain-containing protein [Bradyrhizobium quebecense]
MTKLRKYTLSHNDNRDRWELKQDKTHTFVKAFDTKAEATAGGVLARSLGKEGGSVKIEKISGGYQEERTFPRSADPRKSKG